MAINNVRAVGDDRPWKDEVERELKGIWDALKYGKISLRATSAASAGGGGGGGADLSGITASLPATYDAVTYTIGVDQDAFSHISNLDYAQFDTTTASAGDIGRLIWNDTDGTLEFGLKGGNVTLQIGQEQVMRVRNNTGSTLTEGTVCYFSGSDGTNFNVVPALANSDPTSAQTMGVLTETLNTSTTQHGFLTTFGLVRNIDLSYIAGLADGDQLYLDGTTAGRMTNVKPSAPTHLVYVGICLSAGGGGSNSTIFVKVQNGYELDELHDVQITSATSGDILQRNGSNLWVNKSISAAGIATSANPTFTGTVTTPLTTAGYVTTTSGGVLGSVATIPNAGLTNSAITVNGSSISLGGSATITAEPSGSAGGDLTGTYPNPTIKNDVVLTNPKIGRDNSASEGGQLNFGRASDNATYWYIDSFGSTSTPNLRFIEGSTIRFELVSGGAFSISGQTGSAGQVLTSNGVGSAPTWNTVSGTSSNSFTTINAPAGTDPVATSSTDTLNLANGTGIGITGDSGTKTVTIGVNESALNPTGSVTAFAGSSAPTGWLLCDGSAVSRTTYSTLFSTIGTTYGSGDGSTTFNIPNLKGRMPVGLDSTQTEFDALAETGGAKTHTLTSAEMPSHTHTQNSHTHTPGTAGNEFVVVSSGTNVVINTTARTFPAAGSNNYFLYATSAGSILEDAATSATTATNQNTGGGGAHNNLQPYLVMNYIIKT